jgi:plastocyanin
MRVAAFTIFAILAPAAVLAQPATVEVRLSNFKYEPRTIELKAGQDYVLGLTNDSGGGHNFTAREFFAAATIPAADRAAIKDGTVEVPGHQRRTIRFRATAPGTYKVKCTHTLHGTFGMRGEIVVR